MPKLGLRLLVGWKFSALAELDRGSKNQKGYRLNSIAFHSACKTSGSLLEKLHLRTECSGIGRGHGTGEMVPFVR